MRRTLMLILALASAASAPSPTRGQSDDRPASRISERPDAAPALLPLPRRRVGVDPGVDRDPLGLRPTPGELVREGAFLLNRRGRMLQADDSTWVFVFDPDAQGESEPPMIMQPCLRLTEMERLVASRDETVTFRVSGMALVYRGRNYLIPTVFTTVAAEDLETERPESKVDSAPDAPAPGEDPRVEDLLGEMRRESTPRRTRPAEEPAPRAAPGESASTLLREGLTIIGKRGRVHRGGGGWWTFSPDTGANEPSPEDIPLRLLHCLNLEDLERLNAEFGDTLVYSVSGPVFVYRDRNYLLPTLFRLEPDREGNLMPSP